MIGEQNSTAESGKRPWWKTAWNILRWVLTPFILFLVFKSVRLEDIWTTLRALNPAYFLLALLFFNLQQTLMAWRWHLLLDSNDMKIGFSAALRLQYVSLLFQSFLPSGFGGDAARLALVFKKGRGAESFNSILIARIAGFLALALCVLAGSFFVPENISRPAFIWSLAFLIAGTVTLLAVRYLLPFLRLERYLPKKKFVARAVKTAFNLRNNLNMKTLGPQFLISLLLQIVSVIPSLLLFPAMGLSADFWKVFITVPIITLLVTVIPSINGLGTREYLFFLFFPNEFGSKSVMAAFSLAGYACLGISLLPGLVFWLLPKIGAKPDR